jgi:pSer/pThr/pTyr-binding forkhead associated (FHA) protein
LAPSLPANDAGPQDGPSGSRPVVPALVCLTSDFPRRYPLDQTTMTIGRDRHCQICTPTPFVSREHARLRIEAGNVVIEDLGSRNGVFVNSVRIERQRLSGGDLVTVGETQFRFSAE